MTKYCTSCGAEAPDEAKFCMECGHAFNGKSSSSSSSKGRWEYREFVVNLGGVLVKNTGVASFDGGIPDSRLVSIIEEGVRQLLSTISSEGWEPVEAIGADALWRANKVKRQMKSNMWSGHTSTILIDARINCRRWVAA